MRSQEPSVAPPAQLTLRAHSAAPARVELVYNSARGRALRAGACLALFWGAIPFLVWLPPHYPWVTAAVILGAYLSHRCWTGRYTIRSFAGICPRCGSPLSLGVDRTVDLPHTLTCFSCHFEPRLEVSFFDPAGRRATAVLDHRTPDCTGRWRIRWLADEPFVFCDDCHGGAQATPEARAAADAENRSGEILERLRDEGQPLL